MRHELQGSHTWDMFLSALGGASAAKPFARPPTRHFRILLDARSDDQSVRDVTIPNGAPPRSEVGSQTIATVTRSIPLPCRVSSESRASASQAAPRRANAFTGKPLRIKVDHVALMVGARSRVALLTRGVYLGVVLRFGQPSFLGHTQKTRPQRIRGGWTSSCV